VVTDLSDIRVCTMRVRPMGTLGHGATATYSLAHGSDGGGLLPPDPPGEERIHGHGSGPCDPLAVLGALGADRRGLRREHLVG
jgi:hypothetical protein